MMRIMMLKIFVKRPLFVQLLFTGFAFLLMVILSYFFLNRIVRDNLVRNTESVLDFVQAQIETDVTEMRTILNAFAQTVRGMILNGENSGRITDYINGISNFLQSKENGELFINGVYCYIEKFPDGPVFFKESGMTVPDDYFPIGRPWYIAALAADGGIAVTPPYNDAAIDDYIITYSRAIYDNEGGRLGVVCIDVRIGYIGEKVVNTILTKKGYGFLIAQDFTILAHPNPNFLGMKMYIPEIPISKFTEELSKKGVISEAPLINWKGEQTICFIRRLPNGWYLGLYAIKNVYYHKVRTMALTLSVLGTVLAAVLIVLLVQVDAARNKSDLESRRKSAFLANMSHEMRTPMNAIIGMSAIGKSAYGIERKDYCFKKIEDASKHLLGVINDILDMSKIEANKFEISPAEFDFEKMLQRAVNVVNFRIEEKRQKFSVHIDRSIPKTVIGDDQRLIQILTNLLGNAVKFTPEKGSVALNARFVKEEKGVCTLQIAVSDTGIGISAEQQKKLFQSFEQAESSTTRKYGGTGLGLAICKNIVEMMGGEIWISSELGKGSTFAFTVHVRRGAQDKEELLDPDVNLSNIRILAVDDDPDTLTYFRNIAREFGVTCDTAAGAQDALSLVGQNKAYHIYFVDWKMPVMDGIQLAREIRARTSGNSKIIMLSAAEWNAIAEEAKNAGVDKFLPKPLFPSAITDIIKGCVRTDKQQTEEGQIDIDGIFSGRHILLAEDVEINREIVQTLLEPTQLQIDCAENGAQAVQMFTSAPDKYELIFMDVQMPEMDGYEATRRIRAIEARRNGGAYFAADETNKNLRRQIPIIAMSANVFSDDIERCMEAGMNGHVGKPIDINEVISKLNMYLT